MVVCQGLVHVRISASQRLKMECVDLCLKRESGRCLFELPVQNLPAGVLAKLDERLQKMEKLVIHDLEVKDVEGKSFIFLFLFPLQQKAGTALYLFRKMLGRKLPFTSL